MLFQALTGIIAREKQWSAALDAALVRGGTLAAGASVAQPPEVIPMDKELDIQIIRSQRKTIAMRIESASHMTVRAPSAMRDADIDAFVKKHWDWIIKHRQLFQERESQAGAAAKFTQQEIKSLADQALKIIPERAAFLACRLGVTYGSITIRKQKTRWGSCSSKRNLNFNCLLMLVPPEVRDYVIVHELCHLKEMNHSPRFWAEVEKIVPAFREHKNWLKENQAALIGRL